jgi:hypothetical protein
LNPTFDLWRWWNGHPLLHAFFVYFFHFATLVIFKKKKSWNWNRHLIWQGDEVCIYYCMFCFVFFIIKKKTEIETYFILSRWWTGNLLRDFFIFHCTS